MSLKLFILTLTFCCVFGVNAILGQKRTASASGQVAPRTITIITEPKATVWLDDVKRGKADENGKLAVKFSLPGTRKLRVRADGFQEVTQNLLPAQKGDVKVSLVKTADEAELAFQQAETSDDKQKAAQLYEKAIKLRPKYAEAQLGLARVLSDNGDSEGALKAIAEARKARPGYAEASAVEGRIYKANDNEEKAIASFKRAITEGKGFSAGSADRFSTALQGKSGKFWRVR